MTDTVVDTPAQGDYLSMSDAEIMAAGAPAEVVQAPAEVEEETPASAAVTENNTEAVEDSAADDGAADQAGDESVKEADTTTEKQAETPDTPADNAPALDYEAEYKRLLAPFKANGREISVKSVDDAVTLMQMGANYNKKMAALKPSLKLMKLLENNGLLSEEKISYLIDIEKKNPNAIQKLVKDSGIDPMDFDAEKAGEYKPKIHTVDDREIDLDTVLDEIQDTPTYNQTLQIVSKSWDGASKQVVANTPQLLKVINDHVANGIYNIISEEVERERVFGRLNGLSDIEAYRQVGDAIQARGGFNHLGNAQAKTSQAPVVVQPKPKKADDDKLNEKRRAASSTKPANTSQASNDDFNPLSLSDEEFAKFAAKRFR